MYLHNCSTSKPVLKTLLKNRIGARNGNNSKIFCNKTLRYGDITYKRIP